MFLPAEAVFAEIHARHRDLVDYAQNKCVWITSPTTLMAVLTTALSVIRNVETRQQAHIIKEELGKLGVDFRPLSVTQWTIWPGTLTGQARCG
jgi:DNA recombination protein RmuC